MCEDNNKKGLYIKRFLISKDNNGTDLRKNYLGLSSILISIQIADHLYIAVFFVVKII